MSQLMQQSTLATHHNLHRSNSSSMFGYSISYHSQSANIFNASHIHANHVKTGFQANPTPNISNPSKILKTQVQETLSRYWLFME